MNMNILLAVVLSSLFCFAGYALGKRQAKRYIVYVITLFLVSYDTWRSLSPSLQQAVATKSWVANLVMVNILGVQVGALDFAFAAMLIGFIVATLPKPIPGTTGKTSQVQRRRMIVALSITGEAAAILVNIAIVNSDFGFHLSNATTDACFMPGTYILVLGILPAAAFCLSNMWDMAKSDRMLVAIGTPLSIAIGAIPLFTR